MNKIVGAIVSIDIYSRLLNDAESRVHIRVFLRLLLYLVGFSFTKY